MKNISKKSGFTLIEILVVIGIIAVLAAIVIVAINPARQFAQARNTQRTSNVQTILNAVGQRMADNKGLFRLTSDTVCVVDILTSTSTIASSGSGTIDLRPCLVPTYMSEIPVDPTTGVPYSGGTYDTQYEIVKDATTGRITVSAPDASAETAIANPAPVITLTR